MSRSELGIAHINIQSISTSYNGLQQLVATEKFDFLALTEHWQCQDQLPNYTLPGYRQLSNFCRPIYMHGGCVLYGHNSIDNCTTRYDINSLAIEYVFECCSVQCTFGGNFKLNIVCIYRSGEPNRGNLDIFF